MIKVREVDHLVLRTDKPEELIAFYGQVLGMPVERRLDDHGLIQLRAGRALLDSVPVDSELGRRGGAPPGAEARNLDHFCVRVDPFDEDAIRAHLEAHHVSAGPTKRRYGAEGTGPSIYIEDPDGNTVELKGPPDTPAKE
jgi:catechol 2,3-dioxygenase-like lactoylglutathione lyase family enzyme